MAIHRKCPLTGQRWSTVSTAVIWRSGDALREAWRVARVPGEGSVQFRVLGCLEAEREGDLLRLGGRRDQRVLAALLLDVGRIVPFDRLSDVLWEEHPPATAVKQIRNAVSRLRGVFADCGAADLVLTHAGGYQLVAASDSVDARVFEAEVARAERSTSAGYIAEAAERLRSALDLWRGPVLSGMPGLQFEIAATAWAERRWAACELLYDHQLALGRHREILAELQAFAVQCPLRGKPVGQLMLALHRCGRQADALTVYDAARAKFSAELGLDPPPELAQLRQLILVDDPAVAAPPPTVVERAQSACAPVQAHRRPASGPPGGASLIQVASVPRQLPFVSAHFVGRARALAELDRLCRGVGPPAVVISAIGGMAGVGKTALAVHFAHQVAARFPDGQFYVNLRGFDPSGQPVSPQAAIRGFLDALAVPAEQIPADLDAQAGLYRSLLAGRRVLIVADNARDAAQVRPLLPGTPGSVVLITSRNRLPSLAAAEGASLIDLDVLTDAEARQLLAARLGRDRVNAEPLATAEIIARCGRLPLALAIAAAQAAARPFPLSVLAAELADRRLDALAAGSDPSTDVRTVFSWSYLALRPAAARLFRLLGLHHGPDIAASAIASLAGQTASEVRPLLAELTRTSLLTEHRPGRYALHDLLGAYASQLARTEDSPAQRYAAVDRVLDYYLHSGHSAARLLDPLRDPITLIPPRRGVTPEAPDDRAGALAWFAAEHHVLVAAVRQATDHGLDSCAWQLAWTLKIFLDRRGHWHDQVAVQRAALAAAERLGDPGTQARTHRALADACTQLRRFADAQAHLEQSLDLYCQAGDQVGQAHTHLSLTSMCSRQGRHAEAVSHSEQALDLYRAAGHRRGQASALNTLGWNHALLGDYRQALRHCQRALTLHTELGDRYGQANTWDSLGYANHHLGEHREAVACYQHALGLFRDVGDRKGEAISLAHLSDSWQASGDLRAARSACEQALVIFDDLDHPDAGRLRAKLAAL
jgi:DNA-binding SARP family transcriptional activator